MESHISHVPNITLAVDADTARRMKVYPEIRWSEVARQAIEKRLGELELLDAILKDSKLTEDDVRELAKSVDEGLRRRYLGG